MELYKSRKCQVWYTDFIVAVLIFAIALVIYFEYVNNLSKEEESQLDEMLMSAKLVSNNLMSSGYPDDWNQSNVEIIGVLDNKRVNQTKIEQFYNMSHDTTKFELGITDNYYFYLQDQDGQRISIGGKNSTGLEPDNPVKLVKIDRVTIYNNSITKAVVQIWY
ncbi:hypothetical protein KY345_05580 [Candidatus Woesearchaeota archaeon]|nr:hypothetical protein [Candidatus Woesearchaeota archaeon]